MAREKRAGMADAGPSSPRRGPRRARMETPQGAPGTRHPLRPSNPAYAAAPAGATCRSSSQAHLGMGRNSWKAINAMNANATAVQMPN